MKKNFFIILVVVCILSIGGYVLYKQTQEKTANNIVIQDKEKVQKKTPKKVLTEEERLFQEQSEKLMKEIKAQDKLEAKYLSDYQKCYEAGGNWFIPHVLLTSPEAVGLCNMPTSDAGKECSDSSECENYCQASDASVEEGDVATGTCFEFEHTLCMTEVLGGKATGEWCIEKGEKIYK